MTPAPLPAIDLSIILPVRDERESLRPLLDEIESALARRAIRWEVIAVDDGSVDGSAETLKSLAASRPWLRAIVFRRNYGQSAAFDAGFRAARGAVVVTMDADGQNDPADIPKMLDTMDREGCDFVAGRRGERKDPLLSRRLPSRVANRIIRAVTRTHLNDLGCSLKVYRREFVDDLFLYGEMHRFIGVLVEGAGARTVEVDVHHRPRTAGVSKYGAGRTLKVMLDLFTVWFMRGYQTKPIYVFGGAGLALGALSVALAGYVLYEKLALHVFVHRNPLFILAVIMAVIGVQFLVLGLLAELLVRTYFESQGRRSYRIRERVNCEPAGPAQGEPRVVVGPRPSLDEMLTRAGGRHAS